MITHRHPGVAKCVTEILRVEWWGAKIRKLGDISLTFMSEML